MWCFCAFYQQSFTLANCVIFGLQLIGSARSTLWADETREWQLENDRAAKNSQWTFGATADLAIRPDGTVDMVIRST